MDGAGFIADVGVVVEPEGGEFGDDGAGDSGKGMQEYPVESSDEEESGSCEHEGDDRMGC